MSSAKELSDEAVAAGALVIVTSELAKLLLAKGIMDDSDVRSVGEIITTSVSVLSEKAGLTADDVNEACRVMAERLKDGIVPH